jgi:hypothetical protein
MARRSKTQQLIEGIAGQHLALSLAAHLARTQLVTDPLRVYDGQHLSEMLNVVAGALARTAPVYTMDAVGGEPRELQPAELEGAVARRSAAVLELKDGRTLAGVSVRRSDLRQAIAILKAVGLPDLAPRLPAQADKISTLPEPDSAAVQDGLIHLIAEVEEMLKPPVTPPQLERAKTAGLYIARHTPHGRIANLAMQLISALNESHGYEDVPGGYRMALARLRAALEEAAATNPTT